MVAISDFYNRLMTVYKVDRSQRDSVGGVIPAESVVAENERCAISTATAEERAMHGSSGVSVTHRLWCRAGLRPAIKETMRIRSNRLTVPPIAQVFEVTSIEDPMHRRHHLVLFVRETRGSGAAR